MKKFQTLAVVIGLIMSQLAVAQEKTNNGLNPLSLRPIHESNVMFKTTLWRRIDLKEKQNQPLFANNAELTKHLIEAVKAGLLDAYSNDSVVTKLTLDQFTERLQKKLEGVGLSKEEREAGFSKESADDGWGGDTKKPAAGATGLSQTAPAKPAPTIDGMTVEYYPKELNLIELKEDWIFDKQRSRQYFDIQTLTIKIPSEATTEGLEKSIASFKYKELDRYFRSCTKCIWYNAANIAQHKNLADAFELRLFHGKIVKQSNAKDAFLDDIYKSPKAGLLKSQQLEYELMEFEHNLWEY
jgi:Gliding motility associated protein GldN